MFSCFNLFECFVLTWHPAGEVHATCMRGAHAPSQGCGQITSDRWDCLGINCRHVFANTIRLFYMDENDYVIAVFGSPVIRLTKVFVGYE